MARSQEKLDQDVRYKMPINNRLFINIPSFLLTCRTLTIVQHNTKKTFLPSNRHQHVLEEFEGRPFVPSSNPISVRIY